MSSFLFPAVDASENLGVAVHDEPGCVPAELLEVPAARLRFLNAVLNLASMLVVVVTTTVST